MDPVEAAASRIRDLVNSLRRVHYLLKNKQRWFQLCSAMDRNHNWSWGSRRQEDGAVFPRVWNDETRTVDRQQLAMVAHRVGDSSSSLGYRERMKHLEQVQSRAPCCLVLMDADDITAARRKSRKFDLRILGVGGDIETDDDRTWIQIVRYKTAAEVRLPPQVR